VNLSAVLVENVRALTRVLGDLRRAKRCLWIGEAEERFRELCGPVDVGFVPDFGTADVENSVVVA